LLSDVHSDRDREIVLRLALQIAEIWRSGSYNNNPTNPYAIQERLAVLTHMLGYSVAINCKSGKDRTGIVSAGASTLAAEIAMNGPHNIPQPYPRGGPSDIHRANCSTSIRGTGAYYITWLCTGFRGMIIRMFSFIGLFKPDEIFGPVRACSRFVPLQK
jgi:hypothetical protein